MDKLKCPIYVVGFLLILSIASSIASAAPVIRVQDQWAVNGGSLYDGRLWVYDDPIIWTDGLTDSPDMICYDWDGDNNWNNCYWNNKGCGGSCNANSCNSFPIPGSMGPIHKLGCDNMNNCKEGIHLYNRVCPTCEFKTNFAQVKTIKARVYHKCNLPSKYEEIVSPDFTYSIVNKHAFDCKDAPGKYKFNTKNYVGYAGTWKDILPNINCLSGYRCSENFDDDISTNRAYTAFPDPCRKGDWLSCIVNSECASNRCVGKACSPCGSNQCTNPSYQRCTAQKQLCCDNTPAKDQFFCKSDSTFATCNSTIHTGCQQQGSFFCTFQDGGWKWRACEKGCSNSKCVSDFADRIVTPKNQEVEV